MLAESTPLILVKNNLDSYKICIITLFRCKMLAPCEKFMPIEHPDCQVGNTVSDTLYNILITIANAAQSLIMGGGGGRKNQIPVLEFTLLDFLIKKFVT